MHPNGQLPAYEFAFGDVNPPVHAWACWRVYKMTGPRGQRDRVFLARVFQKLLLNFTWWVNRKDAEGNNLFAGGFLGLDNIGVFDRSQPLPTGGHLEQADGTAWMAFYCATMLSMALELASDDPAYEDMASKFFEHFVAIADAMNTLGRHRPVGRAGRLLLRPAPRRTGADVPLRVRSMVGLIPLFAVEVLEDDVIDRLPGFKKRMEWFLENRPDLARHIAYMREGMRPRPRRAVAAGHSFARAARARAALHARRERVPVALRHPLALAGPQGPPYVFHVDGQEYRVDYVPGESNTGLFGGNSNWRGPVWFPVNYLLIEALERYHHFYGDELKVECPTGSGRMMNLERGRARDRHAAWRASSCPTRPAAGRATATTRASPTTRTGRTGAVPRVLPRRHGRGVGASHQTGWTALAVRFVEDLAHGRSAAGDRRPRRGRRAQRGEPVMTPMPDEAAEWLESRRPRRLRLRDRRWDPHAALPRPSAHGDDAAHRPHGAGERLRRVGRDAEAAGTPSPRSATRPTSIHPDGADARLRPSTPSPGRAGRFRLRRRHRRRAGDLRARRGHRRRGRSAGASLARRRRRRSTVRPFLSGRDYHALHHENPALPLRGRACRATGSTWRPYVGVPAVERARERRRTRTSRTGIAASSTTRSAPAASTTSRTSRRPASSASTWRAGEAVLILAAERRRAARLSGEAAAPTAVASSREPRRSGAPASARASSARPTPTSCSAGSGQTIVAGYPWFADWGRDTFIALRGLCLATGRLEEARDILLEWAGAVSEGMLPNRFPDDPSEPAEFNAVDASLWYVVAVHEYLHAARVGADRLPIRGGAEAVSRRPSLAILDGYARARATGSAMDADGLLAAGEPGVQLTWMDAKVGDWVVTPRIGKPVEVQALWLNALAHRSRARRTAGARALPSEPTPPSASASGTRARLPVRRGGRRSRAGARRRDVPAEPDLRRGRAALRSGARRERARGRGRRRGAAADAARPAHPRAGRAGLRAALRGRRRASATAPTTRAPSGPGCSAPFVEAWVRGARRDAEARRRGPRALPRAAPRATSTRPASATSRRSPTRDAPRAARLPVPGLVGGRGAASRSGPRIERRRSRKEGSLG